MKSWKLYLALVLIFVSGTAVGVIGTGLYLRHLAHKMASATPEETQQMVMKKLSRKLDLRSEQQAPISTVVAEAQTKLMKLREGRREEMRKIFTDSFAQIETVLDDEQKAKLGELRERMLNRTEGEGLLHAPGLFGGHRWFGGSLGLGDRSHHE